MEGRSVLDVRDVPECPKGSATAANNTFQPLLRTKDLDMSARMVEMVEIVSHWISEDIHDVQRPWY